MFYSFEKAINGGKNSNIKTTPTLSLQASYVYWKEQLLERCARLFVWEGLPDTLPQSKLEQQLIVQGYSTITNKFGNFVCYYSTLSDFTGEYFDEPKYSNYYAPCRSGSLKIGKECLIAKNTSFYTSLLPLVHRYALQLAHLELTFLNYLINTRQIGGTPVASTEKAFQSVKIYRDNLVNGKIMPILDPAFATVDFKNIDVKSETRIIDFMETRDNLMTAFYNDIGVRTSKKKKGNMISEEVDSDKTMLLINISDMLNERKIFCEKMKDKYNIVCSVDMSPEIKSGFGIETDEPEREGKENVQCE